MSWYRSCNELRSSEQSDGTCNTATGADVSHNPISCPLGCYLVYSYAEYILEHWR
jgi:hypothetical protein